MTVANLANEWLTHLEQNEVTKEEGTILRIRPRVKKHIIPADRIGRRQLDQLTVAHVEAWLRREAESGGHNGKPRARVTCRDYTQMLEGGRSPRHQLEPGTDREAAEGPVGHEPRGAGRLQEIEGEEVVHPRAVQRLDGRADSDGRGLLQDAHPDRLLIALLSTGARPGEMDALRWERVTSTAARSPSITRSSAPMEDDRSALDRPRPATVATWM